MTWFDCWSMIDSWPNDGSPLKLWSNGGSSLNPWTGPKQISSNHEDMLKGNLFLLWYVFNNDALMSSSCFTRWSHSILPSCWESCLSYYRTTQDHIICSYVVIQFVPGLLPELLLIGLLFFLSFVTLSPQWIAHYYSPPARVFILFRLWLGRGC